MATNSVSMFPLEVGHCRHLEWCSDRGGRCVPVSFPAHCALIRHPTRGWILYDTGYSPEFFRATDRFPERLYRLMLPVTLSADQHLDIQLRRFGLTVEDISVCLISHFHADHIAGLRMFPQARFIAARDDLNRARYLKNSRWRGVMEGYLSRLLPEDFDQRVTLAEDHSQVELPAYMRPFRFGFDLFGDASAFAILLPGHSLGQMGLLLPNADGRAVFLAADSCWSIASCAGGRLPPWPGMFVAASRNKFVETFRAVSEVINREPSLLVLPSHCREAWKNVTPSETTAPIARAIGAAVVEPAIL